MRRLLLLSNSTQPGRGFLDHAAEEIVRQLRGATSLLFVPYALRDRDGYATRAAERFLALGVTLEPIHAASDPRKAVEKAEALFVGGGNTFRLLAELYAQKLIEPIKARVSAGMPYLGASAGTNVACVTIQTTNDMPIVQPPSFGALALVPFNVNPHYMDADPQSQHMGETREQRIREFHEESGNPVVGLREGSWIAVDGDRMSLGGLLGARLFRRGEEPVELPPGGDLSFLLR